MLQGLRKVTRGWFAGALIALLAVAFAIWGINDVFRPVQRDEVATGKGVAITAREFTATFDRALEQVQRQNPQPITKAEAVEQGLDQNILQTLIAQRAIERLAGQLGLRASDAMVAAEIRETPEFASQITGGFDVETYRRLLAENNLGQDEYEREIRGAMTRQIVADAMKAGVRAPASFGRFIIQFEMERRTVSVAELSMGRVGPQPDPTEAELAAFYKANETSLRTPEYRTLSLVIARPEDFSAKVEVPEERVKELFAFRQSQPGADAAATFESKRADLLGELARDEAVTLISEAVERFEDARSGGAAIADAAKTAGLVVETLPPVDAQGATRAGPPAPILATAPALVKAAFAAPANETTDWINTPDGASILARVDAVTPPGVRALDEVKPQLTAMLKSQKARQAMDALVEKVRAEVQAGKAFAQAAQAQRLPVVIRSQSLDRRTAMQGALQALGGAIFGGAKADVVSAPSPDGSALLIAFIEDIQRPDPAADASLIQMARQQADEMLSQEVLAAMQSGAVTAAAVRTNADLVKRTLGVEPAAEGEPQS